MNADQREEEEEEEASKIRDCKKRREEKAEKYQRQLFSCPVIAESGTVKDEEDKKVA